MTPLQKFGNNMAEIVVRILWIAIVLHCAWNDILAPLIPAAKPMSMYAAVGLSGLVGLMTWDIKRLVKAMPEGAIDG